MTSDLRLWQRLIIKLLSSIVRAYHANKRASFGQRYPTKIDRHLDGLSYVLRCKTSFFCHDPCFRIKSMSSKNFIGDIVHLVATKCVVKA